jgi:hypothetical protein
MPEVSVLDVVLDGQLARRLVNASMVQEHLSRLIKVTYIKQGDST